MMLAVKKFVRSTLTKNDAMNQLLNMRDLQNYFENIGWFNSVNEKLPVDQNGNCLPWYTYPAISFLEGRISSGMNVFEYGSGNSTLWWSKRVSNVVSYEHDFGWYSILKGKVPANVSYNHCALEKGDEYSKAVLSDSNKYDVVIIDGRDRINCAKNSLDSLREGGVIVWDNSDRDQYKEGYDFLLENGFRRLDFSGLGPINPYPWCTSVFYKNNNCLGI